MHCNFSWVAFRQHQMQELRVGVGFVVGIVFFIKNLPGLKIWNSQMGCWDDDFLLNSQNSWRHLRGVYVLIQCFFVGFRSNVMLFFFQIIWRMMGFPSIMGFPESINIRWFRWWESKEPTSPMPPSYARIIFLNPLGSPINNRGPIGCTKTQKGHCDFESTWMFGWKFGWKVRISGS